MSLAAPHKWGAVRGLGRAARDGAPPWPGGASSLRSARRAPPPSSRAFSSSSGASSSQASQRGASQLLNRRFLGILRHVVLPVLKGAYLPFTGAASSSAAAPNCAHLARTPFNPTVHGGVGARFFGASVRARVRPSPTVSALKPSLTHGPGLQTARNFSSGGGGGRLFGDVFTNAPLAFRAAVDELDDDLSLFGKAAKGKGKAPTISAATARRGARRSSPAARTKHAAQASARISAKYAARQSAAVQDVSACCSCDGDSSSSSSICMEKDNIEQTYNQYFATAPRVADKTDQTSCGPYCDTCTILRLPAEPDLDLFQLLLGPMTDLASEKDSTHPLDRRTLSVMQSYSEAAAHHRLLISSLQRLLKREGLDPDWVICADDVAAHGRAFDVSFDGWRAEDVRRMLLAEFGVRRGGELSRFLFEQKHTADQPPDNASRAGLDDLHSPPRSTEDFDTNSHLSPNSEAISLSPSPSDAHDVAQDVAEFGVASQVSFQDHADAHSDRWDMPSPSMTTEHAMGNGLGLDLVMPTLSFERENGPASFAGSISLSRSSASSDLSTG
ncbi:hypothetical protein IE81DRAFT_320613 [Ceraceosorus guamensis]|uniref:Uncharacterized protein n=1 Tax=Ceraceosorus guamensis TaxID=1522189 RepID=A0A316W559_9BASI|nr:hypothetical protein IE81DRAFT_320613 [Ceraceosorus guamensis]PWN45017.1 hypothetical protein IE81DRAFT_320613 [Ceraceosorus guamensis]